MSIDELQEAIGYTFRNRELLIEALTHRSYYHECSDKTRSYNERMEFLGDSVLGLAVSESLFNRECCYSEAEMSKMKSYLVSRSILYQIAQRIDLGSYMLLGKGEVQTGGREKTSLLANTLEAVFGAIMLDGGYEKARGSILQLFDAVMEGCLTRHSLYDYKTTLQETSQTLFSTLPEYRLIAETGSDHDKTFMYEVYINGIMMGTGSGRSKKTAQINAARQALEKIRTIDESDED